MLTNIKLQNAFFKKIFLQYFTLTIKIIIFFYLKLHTNITKIIRIIFNTILNINISSNEYKNISKKYYINNDLLHYPYYLSIQYFQKTYVVVF